MRLDGRDAQSGQIQSMMDKIIHRGPDDQGLLVDENVGMGFVRLSILDLTKAGHQPMESRDGRYVITFNGEIFNYLELREELRLQGSTFETESDTEVLLEAFRVWGPDCLDRLNGMWAFAVYDRTERTLFLARDRYGIKPLYVVERAGMLAYASEIPALLSLPEVDPVPDLQSIYDFLVFNRTDHNDSTFFEGIRRLGHGCWMEVDCRSRDGGHAEGRWYDIRERVREADPLESGEEFRALLGSAIKLRLRSDVPVGVCLSGGLDSSAITSLLTGSLGVGDLQTFSAVYGAGVTGDESPFIERYRERVGEMHLISPDGNSLMADLTSFVRALGEPVPSTSPYAQFKVMQLAQGNVVVTIDGQGADELLAGYHYFFGYLFKELARSWRWLRLATQMAAYVREHRSVFGIKAFVYLLLPVGVRDRVSATRRGYLTRDFERAHRGHSGLSGGLYGSKSLNDALIDHFEYKLEHLLKWEDRNSMWHSLEARVPFLDYRVVERVLATPSERILVDGTTKSILRAGMEGHMPEEVRVRRDKMGFGTPQDDWFREPAWEEFIRTLLKSPGFRARGIVDPEAAERRYDRHLAGKVSIGREIWKWIHLELWYRTYIDGTTSMS